MIQILKKDNTHRTKNKQELFLENDPLITLREQKKNL